MIHLQQPTEELQTRRRPLSASVFAAEVEGVCEEVLRDLRQLIDACDDTEQSQRTGLSIRRRQSIDIDLQDLLAAHPLVPFLLRCSRSCRCRGSLQLSTEQRHELQCHDRLTEE